MREALAGQIAAHDWLKPGIAEVPVRAVPAGALLWEEGQPRRRPPRSATTAWGARGPVESSARPGRTRRPSRAADRPYPEGQPGRGALRGGKSGVAAVPRRIRPCRRMLSSSPPPGAGSVLAHSCDAETARSLHGAIPNLITDLAPGNTIQI